MQKDKQMPERQNYYIVMDTDDGMYLKTTSDGHIDKLYVIDNELCPFDIFDPVTDVKALAKALEVFDPNGIKKSKHVDEMMEGYFKSPKIIRMAITENNVEVVVYGVEVTQGIRKHITLKHKY